MKPVPQMIALAVISFLMGGLVVYLATNYRDSARMEAGAKSAKIESARRSTVENIQRLRKQAAVAGTDAMRQRYAESLKVLQGELRQQGLAGNFPEAMTPLALPPPAEKPR